MDFFQLINSFFICVWDGIDSIHFFKELYIFFSFTRFLISYFSHLPIFVLFLSVFSSLVLVLIWHYCFIITWNILNAVTLRSIWNFLIFDITWSEFVVLLLILLVIFFFLMIVWNLICRLTLRVFCCFYFFLCFSLSPCLSFFSPYPSSGAVFPSPPLQTPSLVHLEALHPRRYWDYHIPMLFLVVSLSSWLHRSTES